MRVARARVERVGGALERGVGNARARWGAREGVRLVVRDADGVEGVGEASPLPGYSPDSVGACGEALAQAWREVGAVDEECHSVEEALAAAVAPVAARLAAVPAARFALETALLDALARRRGVAVSRLLGAREGARVARSGLLQGAGAAGWIEGARALLARGVRAAKVKVGGEDFARELADLAALRRALPREALALRLDANGAWGGAARARLEALADVVAPEFVEEPCGGEALLALGATRAPWAADESLADAALARRVLDAGACRAVVLKPALLGGVLATLALARAASARGVAVVVTHVFDGPVALAAACEVALAAPGAIACGLDAHDALDALGGRAVPQLAVPGWITASPAAGLGVRA